MLLRALPEPDLFLPGTGEPSLRWGLIGPGWIANEFVDAVHRHTEQRFVAVGSRSLKRAEIFAQDKGIEHAVGSYEALAAHPAVDVVYIAAPQSEHLDLGLLAIAAGKHVLIEKPLALDPGQAEQLVDAAAAAGVFLMEAMWTRYLPQMSVVRKLVADGALGNVQALAADHGQAIPIESEHRLYKPELGGGALLDLGIYPVQFASMVLGSPREVVAVGGRTTTGVDAYSTLVLRHGQDTQATITTSLLTRTPTQAMVAGSTARIELGSFFYTPTTLRVLDNNPNRPETGILNWEDPTGVKLFDALSWEATALARYVGEGRRESPLHTLSETVSILATLDAARQQLAAEELSR
jgi:predicted dehydrogenase